LHGSAWALRLAFVCIFLVKWGGRVYCANALAKIQIEQDPGDHVRQVTARDCLTRLGFATFFNLFDVPTDQTDLPMQTHIKKPAQPFVVFRSREGIRAWIVGWLSRSQHEVESQISRINNLKFSTCDVPLMLLKLLLAGHLQWSASVLSAIFWSLCSSAWAWWDLITLWGHMVKYRKALTDEAERLKEMLPSDWNGSEDNLNEHARDVLSKLRIAYRNLGMFFGEKVDKRYQLPSTTRRANPADKVQPEDPNVEQANLLQRMQQEDTAAQLVQPPQVGLRGVDAHGAAVDPHEGTNVETAEVTACDSGIGHGHDSILLANATLGGSHSHPHRFMRRRAHTDPPDIECFSGRSGSGGPDTTAPPRGANASMDVRPDRRGAGAERWQRAQRHYLPNLQPRQSSPRILDVVEQAMAEEKFQQNQLKKMAQHDRGTPSTDAIWLAETCMTTLAGPETAPAEV